MGHEKAGAAGNGGDDCPLKRKKGSSASAEQLLRGKQARHTADNDESYSDKLSGQGQAHEQIRNPKAQAGAVCWPTSPVLPPDPSVLPIPGKGRQERGLHQHHALLRCIAR